MNLKSLFEAISHAYPGAQVFVERQSDRIDRGRVPRFVIYAPQVEGTHLAVLYHHTDAGDPEPAFVPADAFSCEAGSAGILGNFGPVPILAALRALRDENLAAYEALREIVRREGREHHANGNADILFDPAPRPDPARMLVERLSAAARAVDATEALERASAARSRNESAYQAVRARHAGAMRALDAAQEALEEVSPRARKSDLIVRHRDDVDRIEARRLGRLRELCRAGREREAADLLRELTGVGGTLSGCAVVAVIESGASGEVLELAAKAAMEPRRQH